MLWVLLGTVAPLQAREPLQVVEDHGGRSALPYYEALNLLPRQGHTPSPGSALPAIEMHPAGEAAMLPVRSPRLSPGPVARRAIEAPGLQPLFLVGDDARSRAWLRQHASTLRDRGATGLVVNVENLPALASLRALVPGVRLWPVAADDLAERLGLQHYPALLSATGIEQ
nr:integrating conjugative element protein [Delftia tsuruhatensis]